MEKIFYNGEEYELATKTMKLARMQETAERAQTLTEAYAAEFQFVKAAIGEDAAREILGTINIEDVDLVEMVKVYNTITAGYDREIAEIERTREAEMFASPALDKITQLADDIRAITSIDSNGNATRPKRK